MSLFRHFIRYVIVLSCGALLVLAPHMAGQALAQSGETHEQVGKTQRRVLDRAREGAHQEVIVVFDHTSTQQSIDALPASKKRSRTDINSARVAHYEAQRQRVFQGFRADEAQELESHKHLPTSRVRIKSEAALQKLLQQPNVIGVNAEEEVWPMLAQSLPLVHQPDVSSQGYQGKGTAVAVIDTGIDYTKSAFNSCTAPGVPANCKVVASQSFVADDGMLDADGHGTNVGAIIAGVAPQTNLISLRVFAAGQSASASSILAALNWVIENQQKYNIVAVNMSLGSGRAYSPITSPGNTYVAAFASLRSSQVIPVVSSGNDGYTDSLQTIAAASGAVSVGAVYDSKLGSISWKGCSDASAVADGVTCFSDSASFLTLFAPGALITAGGKTMGGTSQAAPHVSGALAVLRAAFPTESPEASVARLSKGKSITDARNDVVKPRLDLLAALDLTQKCTWTISSNSQSVGYPGGQLSISVSTTNGCNWTAQAAAANSSWLAVSSGSSGSDSGAVSITVQPNTNVTSRTGTVTVAGQTLMVIQAGSTNTSFNILANGGFELGAVDWKESSASGRNIISVPVSFDGSGVVSGNSSHLAWFCGYNNCTESIYQDLKIPSDAQTAQLALSYWVSTQEVSSTSSNDKLVISVDDQTTGSSYVFAPISNLNKTSTWQTSSLYNFSSFIGKTIRIKITATSDSALPTSFFVDNLSLMISGAAPDTTAPTTPLKLNGANATGGLVNLSWQAATDNIAVSTYQIFKNNILLTTVGNVTQYQDTDLATGVSATYTVTACDASGNCSSPSNAVVMLGSATGDTQPPTIPSSVFATATSTTSIRITWTAATDLAGVAEYDVYRNGIFLASVKSGALSYNDAGLTPATTYSYTVSACDVVGNCSAQSSLAQATTQNPYQSLSSLQFQGNVSTSLVNATTIKINIDKILNTAYYSSRSGSLRISLWGIQQPYFGGTVNGYILAQSRTSAIAGLTDQLYGGQFFSNLSLSLPYAQPPSLYQSKVLFLEEYQAGSCATTDHFCIVDYVNLHESTSPTVPTSAQAFALDANQITISWNASSDNVAVTSYKVYRNGVLASWLGNVTTYTDRGLMPNTSYSYTVAACDAVLNCSLPSVAATAVTYPGPDLTPPATPTGLTANVLDSTHIQLAWNASTDNVGVATYNVYVNGQFLSAVGNVTRSLRTNAPGASYRYSVSACDLAGNCSAQSSSVTVTMPALQVSTTTTSTTTSTSTSTSTTAQTTTSTLMSSVVQLVKGWNLVGNGWDQPLDVARLFGDSSVFTTVWKWVASKSAWAFYAPSMNSSTLATYAQNKNYEVLTTLNPGEGFWVNAAQSVNFSMPNAIQLSSQRLASTGSAALPKGWSLIAVGDSPTPHAFNQALGGTPPSTGGVPINLTTLWAWDSAASNWMFYAPSLLNAGTLESYIGSKGYVPFGSKALTPATGFWVNMP